VLVIAYRLIRGPIVMRLEDRLGSGLKIGVAAIASVLLALNNLIITGVYAVVVIVSAFTFCSKESSREGSLTRGGIFGRVMLLGATLAPAPRVVCR
jgi:hypothetical protein